METRNRKGSMLRITTAIGVVFASQLIPGSAGAGQARAAAPEVRLDDLAASAGWRAGDFPLPSPASAAGTSDASDAPESCSVPDDDRCETWASTASQQFDSLSYGWDAGLAAEMSPDGRHMFVAGSSSVAIYDQDVGVASFDPSTGAVQWIIRRDGGLGVPDVIYDVTVSPDSSMVFVVGFAQRGNPCYGEPLQEEGGDVLTMAFDAATGATLWQRAADPSGLFDRAYAARVSPDGSALVVAGDSGSLACSAEAQDPVSLAYSTATGDLLWTWTDPGPAKEEARHVAVGTDAAYLLAYDHNGSNYDTVLHALDLDDGELRWTARFDGGNHDTPTGGPGVAVDEEHGRVYLLCLTEVQSGGADYGIAAYDIDTGDELWRASFAGARNEGVNIPSSLLVVPDDDPEHDRTVVIATGLMENNGFADYDFGTVAYDGTTGAELWRDVYGSDRDERAWDMALSPDRATVYVTGRNGPPYGGGASGGSSVDLATLSYDVSTGERRWAARYVGSSATGAETGGDPAGVGVTPDGRWVVTGGLMNYPVEQWAVNPRDFVAVGYEESAS